MGLFHKHTFTRAIHRITVSSHYSSRTEVKAENENVTSLQRNNSLSHFFKPSWNTEIDFNTSGRERNRYREMEMSFPQCIHISNQKTSYQMEDWCQTMMVKANSQGKSFQKKMLSFCSVVFVWKICFEELVKTQLNASLNLLKRQEKRVRLICSILVGIP